MNQNPISGISVVIPLFNKQAYIEECLKSVLSQNYSPFEVLVVDDGSTDRGPDLVRKFNDPRIKLIQQKNAGVSAARNKGVQEAKYEHIAFIDADDQWLEGHLKSLHELAKKFPETGFWSTGFIARSGVKNKIHSTGKPDAFFPIRPYLEAALSGKILVHTSACMVHRQNFLKVGSFMEGFNNGEDHALWLRLALNDGVAINGTPSSVYQLGVADGLTQNLIIKPDAQSVAIDAILSQDGAPENDIREMLLELKHQKFLAYSISAALKGEHDLAKKHLSNAVNTKRFRKRVLQLKFLLLFRGLLLSAITRLLVRIKNAT